MAVTIDVDNNIYLKQDDGISFNVITTGKLRAAEDDTAVFMVKTNVDDDDGDAIISKNITVGENNVISVVIASSITSALTEGTYYWSVKLTKDSNTYTIIPDDGDESFPTFVVGEVLIDG